MTRSQVPLLLVRVVFLVAAVIFRQIGGGSFG